jgi:hypothetical protein
VSRNFLFDVESGTISTPVSLVCDTVKRFSSETLPIVAIRTNIAPIGSRFRRSCNTSPYPNPAVARFRTTDFARAIPSVAVAARSGLASLRTAAASDVLQPAVARRTAHVLPAVRPSSPAIAARRIATSSQSSTGSASPVERRSEFSAGSSPLLCCNVMLQLSQVHTHGVISPSNGRAMTREPSGSVCPLLLGSGIGFAGSGIPGPRLECGRD